MSKPLDPFYPHPEFYPNIPPRFLSQVYHQILRSSSVFVHDCSMVSPLALIFFGRQVSWGHADGGRGEVIQVDDFVKFHCAEGTADLVRKQCFAKLTLRSFVVAPK